jgi:uncharacterized YigZ family protein
MNDEYKAVTSGGAGEIKIRGSRFIARAFPLESKEKAEEILAHLRHEFHDATHQCFAYRLGPVGDATRFTDDGEPSGTAGKAILACLERRAVTNVLVAVIRYFGGVKLGTGGLRRAYTEAAELALSRATTEIKYAVESISATFPHGQIGSVMRIVSKAGARISDTFYDEEVHLRLELRKSKIAGFKEELIEATHGNVRF